MKEQETESKLKRFIKDAFTSEAKASRITYYFFAICILLTVICIQLNTANLYLKRIASGGAGAYSFETNGSKNDPFEIFSDKTDETKSTTPSDSKPSESSAASQSVTDSQTETKPQGALKTYIINKSSKKIHYPSCTYAENMKEENKITVKLTYDGLQNQYLSKGYVFCSKCIG